MLPIILSFTTFVSTSLGGLFALGNKDKLHRILGFTAGVLLGVVAFDVMPEIFHLTFSTHTDPIRPMVALVLGFLVFHIAEKLMVIHSAHEDTGEYDAHHHPRVGVLSAVALSFHSFLDGVGIGLAFQAGTAVGVTVAIAVIAHDFADGLNTVTLMLKHRNTPRHAFMLLMVDATTPILGAASTLFFHLPSRDLLLYLGFFAGFLLYIGASDILPEAHTDHPSQITLLLTVLGAAFIFVVTRFAL